MGRGSAASTGVLHEGVGESWPLISLLVADEVYHARYLEALEHALGGLLAPAATAARLEALHALVAPHVAEEEAGSTTISSLAAFEASVDGLIEHLTERRLITEAAQP